MLVAAWFVRDTNTELVGWKRSLHPTLVLSEKYKVTFVCILARFWLVI